MSNIDYGPLNVELRAHETELLDEAFFRQLLAAKSIDEAVKLLQGTAYEFIKDPNSIDMELRSYISAIFSRAFRLSPDKEIIEFSSLYYSYHNLKVLFKDYYTDYDLQHLLIPIGRYDIEDLRSAVRTGSSQVLTGDYLKVINEVRDYIESYQNLNHIDIILDYFYLAHLFDLAKSIGQPVLIKLVQEMIDLNSIIISLRLSKLDKSVSSLSGMVPDLGQIPIKSFINWSKEGYQALSRHILDSPYQNLLQSCLSQDQVLDAIKIEKVMDNRKMQILQAAKFESFGPLPVIAYLYAKQTEVKNLRLIISGILNQLPKESLEQALRLNYF